MDKKNKLQGIIYAVFSAIAFGLIPIFVKFAYNAGASSITVVFLRFLFSVIILTFYFMIKNKKLTVDKKLIPRFAFLGLIGYAGTSLTLFISYQYISVGLATAIHFVYPAIVTLFSIMFFKEGLTPNKLISLALCLLGVGALVGLGNININIVGVIYALLSGLVYSFYIIGIDYSEIRKIDTLVLIFYILIFAVIGTFIFGIATKSLALDFKLYGFISIFALAIVCTIIPLSIFAKAILIIGSSNAAILSTLEPITSIVLSAIIFKEVITFNTLLGSLLIIGSVYVLLIKRQIKIPKLKGGKGVKDGRGPISDKKLKGD